MNFLTNLADQLKELWQRSNNAYRVAFVGLSTIAIVIVVLVGWWSSRPHFIPLADNLSPSEAAEIRSKLQAEGIPYRLGFSASVIEVPESQWNDARLAAREALPNGQSLAETGGNSILSDPLTARHRLLAERQRTLERTILQMKSVESVNVHIAMPEPSPFVRQRGEVKASVMLGIRNGTTFTPEMASTVAAMVAGAVENLPVDNVTVTDQNGHVLVAKGLSPNAGYANQFDYRRRIEADLAAKAEDVLAQMLGPGRAVVRVAADIDFTEKETVEQTYDPDSKVALSESITSEKSTPNAGTASGPAGTASNNVSNFAQTISAAVLNTESETIDTDYAFGSTLDTIRNNGGVITRMTVGAIVDLPAPDANANPPVRAVTQQDVQDVIKQVVGIDETRGDQIKVVVSKLSNPPTSVVPLVDTINQWDYYGELVKNASLGIAAIISLVLGVMLIRKIKPITLTTTHEAVNSERSTLLAELTTQAQQNPELVSRIMSAWLNNGSSPADSGDSSDNRSAAA